MPNTGSNTIWKFCYILSQEIRLASMIKQINSAKIVHDKDSMLLNIWFYWFSAWN